MTVITGSGIFLYYDRKDRRRTSQLILILISLSEYAKSSHFQIHFLHMPDYDLRFSTCATDDAGTYKLLELSPDLVQLVGKAEDSSRPLV